MPFEYYESNTYAMLTGTGRGRTVVWQKPASGDKFAPYKNPSQNLKLVRLCSDFGYYPIASGYPLDVTINHPAIAADGGTEYSSISSYYSIVAYNQIVANTYTLTAHGLGVEPNYLILVKGYQYPAGCPVQLNGYSSRRSVSFYADSTNLYVRESCRPGPQGLPAISITYKVAIFRPLGPLAGAPLYYASPGRVRLGYGSIDTNEHSMREADASAGETANFFIPIGETMDIYPRPRFTLPDGSVYDIGSTISGSGNTSTLQGAAVKGFFI